MSNPYAKSEHSALKDIRQGVTPQKEYLTRGKKKSPAKLWYVYYKPEGVIREIFKYTDEWVELNKFATREYAEKWIEKKFRRTTSKDKEQYRIEYMGTK
ncbi:MAG: hypothetical protein K9J28_07585 [Sulfuritalea sp.]|nr:hypothetical protein [Sulfuritalea sp.]